MADIIVCDDEELIRWSVSEHLRKAGHVVRVCADGAEALEAVGGAAPDVLILDLKMPHVDGLEVLRRLQAAQIPLATIMMTAHGAIDSAIEATRLGAVAYLAKPFDLRELSLHVDKAIEQARLSHEVRYLRDKAQVHAYGKLVGVSPPMQALFETLERLERVDAPTVLITGESGTGKDLVAQAIHARGPRRDKPFLEIDCAALPDPLIESELFGHEKGSFTDAHQMKRGLFEVARGGTIFLDEIGNMALSTQAKLLRALENRKFKRVGGVVDIPLDAGIIAATNRGLKEAVKSGQFREDLYFRLHVVPIELQPLRQRRADIAPIAVHLLARTNIDLNRRATGFTPEAMRILEAYAWPGNARELRNVIERALILKRDDGDVSADELPLEIRLHAAGGGPDRDSKDALFVLPPAGINLDDVEANFVRQALELAGGNQSQAARLLGISRYALRYRLEKISGDATATKQPRAPKH